MLKSQPVLYFNLCHLPITTSTMFYSRLFRTLGKKQTDTVQHVLCAFARHVGMRARTQLLGHAMWVLLGWFDGEYPKSHVNTVHRL